MTRTKEPKRILGFSELEVNKERPMKIYCPFCKSESFKPYHKKQHAVSTVYRCVVCDRLFSARRFTGYAGLRLPPEKIVQIVNCLIEGVSIRATARLVGVEKRTVSRIMRHAADICQCVMDDRLSNLRSRYLQAD